MFDNYTLKARYYPVILLFMPIIVTGFFYSLQFESILHFLSSLGVAGALTYLFSQLGRDQGKRKEPFLWRTWGGAPTMQIMRLSNTYFDNHTKQRYHQKLQQLCPVPTPPDATMESNSLHTTDEIYRAWTKYLISQTRDKSKFSLLFKENTSYGFRRNLWGLRPFAIGLAIIVLSGNYFFWALTLNVFNPRNFPNSFIYTSVTVLLVILFWLLIVTKNWIKSVAFAYSERLCESVDNL